jgi:PKD repeat protein
MIWFKRIALIYCIIQSWSGRSQITIYREIQPGGVTAAGVNTGQFAGQYYFDLDIPPGSSIRKAYLIANEGDYRDTGTVFLNGHKVLFNEQTQVTSWSVYFQASSYYYLGRRHVVDVTDLVLPSWDTCSLYIPVDQILNARFTPFYLVVVFENFAMPETAIELVLNAQNASTVTPLNLTGINRINNFFDVGFAFVGDQFCGTWEGSHVYVNNDSLGLVDTEDWNTIQGCVGVQGHFAYYNNTLIGLGDDIPDVWMDSADALSNIQSSVAPNVNSLSMRWEGQTAGQPSNSSNPIVLACLAYTSPCSSFVANAITDTLVCHGSNAQLWTTGGNLYNWEPSTGLSCSGCPDPIFTGDSSMLYTVRITGAQPGCSKVFPVKVNVAKPVQSAVDLVASSECEQPSGTIELQPATGGTPPFFYTVNGIAQQANALFENLAPGQYPLLVTDAYGCEWRDTATVGEFVAAQADFTANPTAGETPLTVSFTNQSTGAQNYVWITNGDTAYTLNYSHTYTQQGSHPVVLVVWNTDSTCTDTASLTIAAETNIRLIVPTLYSSGDGTYTLQTWGTQSLHVLWYDAAGRTVIDREYDAPGGIVPLGAVQSFASGVYSYHITATGEEGEKQVFEGKVVVIR